MLHPSLPPCRAPAQVLCAGPTKPRQQGPTATAHAGDTGHPHHTTAAGAVSSWNSCPGSCCCISHSKSSSKLKAQAWAGQSATSAQLSSDPGLSVFLQGVVLRQHSCSHTLTHNLLWPTVLHQRKTSQHSIPVYPKGTDFPPPVSTSNSWRTYFYERRELLYPCCMPQLCPEKVELSIAITAQLWTSPELRDQTAHGNSIHTNSQRIGTALESCMHFSEASCHEKIPNHSLK